jgi:hypothetical protein
LVGLVYGGSAAVLLVRALERSGTGAIGPADRVTLARSMLVGGVAASTYMILYLLCNNI